MKGKQKNDQRVKECFKRALKLAETCLKNSIKNLFLYGHIVLELMKMIDKGVSTVFPIPLPSLNCVFSIADSLLLCFGHFSRFLNGIDHD